MNKYSKNGRTLIVKFTCSRCGYQQDEEYEKLVRKDENDYVRAYEKLHTPDGWTELQWYGRILCPECNKAFQSFLEGADK